MTSNLPIIPVILPLIGGIVLTLTRERLALSRILALAINAMGLVVAAVLVERVRIEGIQVLQ